MQFLYAQSQSEQQYELSIEGSLRAEIIIGEGSIDHRLIRRTASTLYLRFCGAVSKNTDYRSRGGGSNLQRKREGLAQQEYRSAKKGINARLTANCCCSGRHRSATELRPSKFSSSSRLACSKLGSTLRIGPDLLASKKAPC